MNTYYYILCNDCKEKTPAASRTAGGVCHLADSENTLLPFIIAHSDHNVAIVSEHTIELHDPNYGYVEVEREKRGEWEND
jgi:hypothetical protein